MELGIALPTMGVEASPDAITYIAQTAERMGYASVWTFERLLRPLHPVGVDGQTVAPMRESYRLAYDPIDTLAFVAGTTSRIKLGTSVVDALFHPPVVLARRFATLDQLSGGRVIAGLGQGSNVDEFVTANVPYKRRGAGFEEYLQAVRAVWAPDPVQFEGRFYHIPESEIGPKPVQVGGPPIIIGGSAPRAIERAARLADGINPGSGAGIERLQQIIDGYERALRLAGRDRKRQMVVVRANTNLTTAPLPEPRQFLSGDAAQVSADMQQLAKLGVDHLFFDLNYAVIPVTEQVELLNHLPRL